MDLKVLVNVLGAIVAFVGMFRADNWVPFFVAFWWCVLYLIYRFKRIGKM
jgi:hypothetical protein